MGSMDDMKRIRLMASVLGYSGIAEAAGQLIMANPPFPSEMRLNIITSLKSALHVREEDREQQSIARSQRIHRLYDEKLEFIRMRQ